MTQATSPSSADVRTRLELRGGNWELWNARDVEILCEGPAGTGKTFTILNLMDAICREYDGCRMLIVRKRAATLTTTCLATFNDKVLKGRGGVTFVGSSEKEPASYRYSNGSRINVGGMSGQDEASKVLSSEYDLIFVNEAVELTLEDWETLLTRLRHGTLEHQRLIGDTNPTFASHWLMQRSETGRTRLIKTRLQDNPAYFDAAGNETPDGTSYLGKLDQLTGTRYQRFKLGLRVGVENACYPMFDRSVHVRPLEPGLFFKATIIWEDYGSRHKCSIGALSIDQYNRRWVRECWGQPDTDGGKTVNLIVAQYKERYQTTRGRVDPNQAYLAGQHGFNVAKGGNGGASGPPRLHRIDLMEPLFYSYPGGRVPSFREEKGLVVPQGPFAEPDSPGFFLVEGMPGNDELADQVEGYHFVFSDTPKGVTKDVYRDNEDHVAGVEYANEEWEEGTGGLPTRTKVEQGRRNGNQPAKSYARF